MSLEIVLSIGCNLSCPHCYQNAMRDAGVMSNGGYDIDKVIAAIREENSDFTLFGGEALLTPVEDIEKLWAFGLKEFGKNGIQTNATLITDEHIKMFKKYKVSVGLSMDGPGELNDSRWAGSLEKTRLATQKSQQNIVKLIQAGVIPSVIITLYRKSISKENRRELMGWLWDLQDAGIRNCRFHLLEVDHPDVDSVMRPTPEEYIDFFTWYFDEAHDKFTTLSVDLFDDIKSLLKGTDGSTTCVWNACDAKMTSAVRGIDGHGNRENCGRTNKTGVNMLKIDSIAFQRQVALYFTQQQDGGCSGCEYFVMCKGECPGTGIDGDWRNRTDQCLTWKYLFGHFASELGKDATVALQQREELEEVMVKHWQAGVNINIAGALEKLRTGSTEINPPQSITGNHGDVPHGDAHGDSDADPAYTHVDDGQRFGDNAPYQEETHGDRPHGDNVQPEHMDHDDAAKPEHGDVPHGDSAGGVDQVQSEKIKAALKRLGAVHVPRRGV